MIQKNNNLSKAFFHSRQSVACFFIKKKPTAFQPFTVVIPKSLYMFHKSFLSAFLLSLGFTLIVALTNPFNLLASELKNSLEGLSQKEPVSSIAILPIENLSDFQMASQLVSRVLKEELTNSYNVALIEESIVDKFITSRRIRYTGALSTLLARDMGNDLGIDKIMIISIDLFEETPTQLIVGLTSRLISAIDGSIIWSNSVSYSGHDFQRFLGLGIINSPETLSSIVIKELISNFPGSYFPGNKEVVPFEVAKVVVSPYIGTSNDKITLSVEIKNFDIDPHEVRAILGGNETVLSKFDKNKYKGSFIAPVSEGYYHVDVIAIDKLGTSYPFYAVAKVTIDNTPPQISLALNRRVFAPRNKGFVTITPDLHGYEKINEWAIEIVDENGELVRNGSGYGKIPKKFIWRGRTNTMAVVSDGKYVYSLKVKDEAGNETVVNGELTINHKPPVINVDVDIAEDTLEFTFDKDGNEELESWQFSMLQEDGKILKQMSGRSEFPEKIEFPIDGGMEIGSLSFSVDTTDIAGNTFALKKSISNYISKGKVPFARLRKINNSIENF